MSKNLFKIIIFSLILSNLNNGIHPEKIKQKKPWNFMVYITRNNDLFPFAALNIEQMKKVGSNKNVNILVQQDVYGKEESKRIFIEKDKQTEIEKVTTRPECISGTPESLYSFVEWAIKNYPAEKHALILWDHGSGIVDIDIWKNIFKFNPLALYKINIETGLFELNRELLSKRGICFNEIFEVYLNNQELKETLKKVSENLLKNKKLDVLAMDACNMNMLEVASQVKDYVKYMVGSEEAEPGTGWNYELVLEPFKNKTQTTEEFSKNIVTSYQKHYEKSYVDFTQSAINLEKINLLENNIDQIAKQLILLLKSKSNKKICKNINKLLRNRLKTTWFANPDYIDIHHFFVSMHEMTSKMLKIKENKDIKKELEKINQLTKIGTEIIKDLVIAKTFCSSLPFVQGLAFYFPTRRIHKSYPKTDFAKSNSWYNFLKTYLEK
ncbi:hypothetical protein GF385_03350 [Candidatus Dependentiae bacterium]|nr:hypothetical protein [Candidatus Dependentiae bacterium]